MEISCLIMIVHCRFIRLKKWKTFFKTRLMTTIYHISVECNSCETKYCKYDMKPVSFFLNILLSENPHFCPGKSDIL